jgi:hypothetical protein
VLHEDGEFSYQENTMRVVPNNVLPRIWQRNCRRAACARAEALAYAKEVANLCALAGQPERTSVFMRAETPVADVRKKLTDANAVGKAAWGKAVQAVNMRMGFRKA